MLTIMMDRARAVKILRDQLVVKDSYENDKISCELAEAMILAILALENQGSSFIDGYTMGCGLLARKNKK